MKKNSKFKTILFVLAVFIFIAGIGFLYNYQTKTVYNKETAIGNTGGNLSNKGLFCEYNGTVFFSNPYDQGRLYSMTKEGTHIKRLTEDSASYINATGKYVYYIKQNSNIDSVSHIFRGNLSGIRRIHLDGSHPKTLSTDVVSSMSLAGNALYYLGYNTKDESYSFQKVEIDGEEQQKVVDEAIIPSSIYYEKVYFNGITYDHNIRSLDTRTHRVETVYEGNCFMPIVEDGYLYFLDMDENYALARVLLGTHEKKILTTERIDTYNIYGNYIYYQVNHKNNPKFCRMNIDGSNPETIATGNFTDINITSAYVYFKAFGTDYPIYKTPTSGNIEVTTFDLSSSTLNKD